MKSVTDSSKDAYVVAEDKTSAISLYRKKFSQDPDYSMCMDCGEASILVEEKTE